MSFREEKLQAKGFLTGKHFIVVIDHKAFSFAKVENGWSAMPYSQSNGVLCPAASDKTEVLKLERGYVRGRDAKYCWEPGRIIRDLMILVKSDQGKLIKKLATSNGIIIKHSFSNLDGMGDQVYMEYLEIVHTGLVNLI